MDGAACTRHGILAGKRCSGWTWIAERKIGDCGNTAESKTQRLCAGLRHARFTSIGRKILRDLRRNVPKAGRSCRHPPLESEMYYEEKVINGVLCSRSSPDGEWEPFTLEALTIAHRVEKLQREGLEKLLAEAQKKINAAIQVLK